MADQILTKITDNKVILSVEENYIAIKNVGDHEVVLVDQHSPLYVTVKDQHTRNDANFIYNQNTASDVWTINHNLSKYCSVTVVDSNNEIIYGEVLYNSLNNITVSFNAQITGKAYLN